MKKFLAIYLGSPNGENAAKWKALSDEARREREMAGMTAWMEWANKNHDVILDMGSPLGKTKQIDANGISNTSNTVAAYTIVEAESHEVAAKIFLQHPHFTLFPGDSVQIMECLPIPGM